MKPTPLLHSRLALFWRRWRFHLSALIVAVPLIYTPVYFDELALNGGAKGLGEREIGERTVGPWTVRIAELLLAEPLVQGAAGPIKEFTLGLCQACVGQVKASYLRVGKPRNIRTAGAIFSGSPYRQTAGVAIPETTKPDAELWLTLEGWDGSLHQTPLPLSEASPITVSWLAKRGQR